MCLYHSVISKLRALWLFICVHVCVWNRKLAHAYQTRKNKRIKIHVALLLALVYVYINQSNLRYHSTTVLIGIRIHLYIHSFIYTHTCMHIFLLSINICNKIAICTRIYYEWASLWCSFFSSRCIMFLFWYDRLACFCYCCCCCCCRFFFSFAVLEVSCLFCFACDDCLYK